MIPVLAASVGEGGFAHGPSLGGARSPDEIALVQHEDLTVAWSTTSAWTDHHDDADVLVVVDGRLHRPLRAGDATAELVWSRYRERGGDFATDLLGDFVVVILDRGRRSLLVSRDPLGVRPWYEAADGRRYAGASSEGSVAGLAWVDDRVDERAAIEHLAALSESRGRTFHRGVETLPPGHTTTAAAGAVRRHRHHTWRLEPELDIPWGEAVERCREHLDTAVAARLHTGGPATSELSGGLDSSAVVGTAVRLGHSDLVAGRLAFDGPAADERRWSDAVLDHWGLRVVTAEPWMPDDAEAKALTRTLRRPLPDPHFTMFAGLHRQLLALGRPDGLTGLGGDDAFVTSSTATLLVSALRMRRWSDIRDLVAADREGPGTLWTGLARPALHHVARWRGKSLPYWISGHAAGLVDLPSIFRARPVAITGIDAVDERIGNISSGQDAMVLETRAVVADLEGRRDSHPFLDPRLIEATYGLDPWWPRRGGHTRALQVAAYRDRLPPAVAARRTKAEFSEVFWRPLLDGATLDDVRTGPIAEEGWLDRDGFETLVARASSGMANAAIPLSRCVSLDRWFRTC